MAHATWHPCLKRSSGRSHAHPHHVGSYESFLNNHGSHLPILTLTWAYVLSARWAEIIPDASIQYTDSVAMVIPRHLSEGGSTCYVGDATPEGIRWWSAVLAPDAGWTAFIPHNGRNLESPWAVCLQSAGITICFDSDDAYSLKRHAPCPPQRPHLISWSMWADTESLIKATRVCRCTASSNEACHVEIDKLAGLATHSLCTIWGDCPQRLCARGADS